MNVAEFLDPAKWLAENAGPRYLQLRRRIEEGIQGGVLEPEAPLPPERELATLTGLSRVTVRKATQAMVEDGMEPGRLGEVLDACRVQLGLDRWPDSEPGAAYR